MVISHMTTLTTLLAGGDVEDCGGGGYSSSIVERLEVLSFRLWSHCSCSFWCPLVKVLWSGIVVADFSSVAKSVLF